MAKVYEFLADGFEEIEALAPVDVLRRGGVETVTVSTGVKRWRRNNSSTYFCKSIIRPSLLAEA